MFSRKLAGALGAGIFTLGIAAAATPAQAAELGVNNTNSNGAGSLRSAINAPNGTVDELLAGVDGEADPGSASDDELLLALRCGGIRVARLPRTVCRGVGTSMTQNSGPTGSTARAFQPRADLVPAPLVHPDSSAARAIRTHPG